MSQVRTEEFECPHCHKTGEFEIWNSINVDLNPELREQVMNDEIFMNRCPHCGKVFGIPFSFIYHDMHNRFMLFFGFEEPDTGKYNDIEIPENDFLSIDDYTFRAVYGRYNLKDKILIFERGLNDVAVERLKYMAKHISIPELKEKGMDLYVDHFTGPDEEYKYGTLHFHCVNPESGEEGNAWFEMNVYYEHEYACKFDPRMKFSGKCPCIDSEWMESKIRNV